jgi:hypothetical protein
MSQPAPATPNPSQPPQEQSLTENPSGQSTLSEKSSENKPVIRGEPLDLDDLLNFAVIDATDAEFAAEWWDENATPAWRGALDNVPVKK